MLGFGDRGGVPNRSSGWCNHFSGRMAILPEAKYGRGGAGRSAEIPASICRDARKRRSHDAQNAGSDSWHSLIQSDWQFHFGGDLRVASRGALPLQFSRVLRDALSGVCARRGVSGRVATRGISEDSRSPRDRGHRPYRRNGALAIRQSVRFIVRDDESVSRLPGFPDSLERRRPGHPNFRASEGGVRPSAVSGRSDCESIFR